jgi:hypothetical protein
MQTIFDIFQIIKKESLGNLDGFNIASLPSMKHHKIGVSSNGQPMFFIKCDNSERVSFLDSNLEFIAVQFNRECQLLTNKQKIEEGIYTIIYLKTDSIDLQEYFLEIVFLIIKKLNPVPTLQELKIEVEKLIELFSKFSQPPTKAVQGLWAELLVIAQSKNPAYLIRAWHNSATDKFDFNDGIDKIEVKSTSKNRRVHSFSIEQLHPNQNSKLIISSIVVVETGIGKNIFDLVNLIENKVKDRELHFRINEIIAQTLGNSLSKSFELYFDYQLATDSVQFYDCENILRIDLQTIPIEVTNVRFDSDLTNIQPIKKSKTKSILHNSLF